MFGVEAEIVEINCPIETAVERNIHGVSEKIVETIYKTMRANDPLIPPWWKRTIL